MALSSYAPAPERHVTGTVLKVHSPRIPHRAVVLCSQEHFDHYVLVESDPSIATFCEYPGIEVRLNGSAKVLWAPFHMWVRWRDGHEALRLVAKAADKAAFERNPRSRPLLKALSDWCSAHGCVLEIVTAESLHELGRFLANWKLVLAYLQDLEAPERRVVKGVLKLLAEQGPLSLGQLLDQFADLDPVRVIRGLFWCLYRGRVSTDLRSRPLSPSSEFRLAADASGSERRPASAAPTLHPQPS